MWKLHEHENSSYIYQCRQSSQKDASVEGYWKDLKGTLLEAANGSCGWTKCPARHKET